MISSAPAKLRGNRFDAIALSPQRFDVSPKLRAGQPQLVRQRLSRGEIILAVLQKREDELLLGLLESFGRQLHLVTAVERTKLVAPGQRGGAFKVPSGGASPRTP